MAFNDIYRLRIYQRMHTAQVVNVLHFVEELAPVGGGGAAALANDFVANMSTTLRARAIQNLQFDYVEVQSLVPFSGASAVANFPANTFGTIVANSPSATLAEVMSIYTSRAGRRGRGRLYFAGADVQNAASQGQWTSTQTTRTQTLATALATRYMVVPVPAGFALGVWSRASGPVDPPWSTAQFTRATALTVRTIIRNQRRRQVGVGR